MQIRRIQPIASYLGVWVAGLNCTNGERIDDWRGDGAGGTYEVSVTENRVGGSGGQDRIMGKGGSQNRQNAPESRQEASTGRQDAEPLRDGPEARQDAPERREDGSKGRQDAEPPQDGPKSHQDAPQPSQDALQPSRDAQPAQDAPEAHQEASHSPLSDQTPPAWTNGIALDEEGLLWIADGTNSQLIRITQPPNVQIIERYGKEAGIDQPDDLVITSQYIYWTSVYAGVIGKFDRGLGKSTELAKPGDGTNPIAWDGNTLLIGRQLYGSGLYRLDPTGATSLETISTSIECNGFNVAPDGYLYCPSYDTILRIDSHEGSKETLYRGFFFVSAVRYNPQDGFLYALEDLPATLYRLSLDGKAKEVFATLSDAYYADNFTIDAHGTFFITRFSDPILTRVTVDGKCEDFHIGGK